MISKTSNIRAAKVYVTGSALLRYCCVALLLLVVGGCSIDQFDRKDYEGNLESTTKKLLDREALRSLSKHHGVEFSPKYSRLANKKQIEQWLEKHGGIQKRGRYVQSLLRKDEVYGLIIEKFTSEKGYKVPRLLEGGGIFLPMVTFPNDTIGDVWIPDYGIECWTYKCLRCTGCRGPDSFCICYETCYPNCQEECPRCPGEDSNPTGPNNN